jgi:hypothetical protein
MAPSRTPTETRCTSMVPHAADVQLCSIALPATAAFVPTIRDAFGRSAPSRAAPRLGLEQHRVYPRCPSTRLHADLNEDKRRGRAPDARDAL